MTPPAGLVIRPVRPEDEPALMELWCSAWEGVVPGLDLRAQWDTMLAQWAGLMAAGAVAHVAELGGRPAGLLVLDAGRRRLEQLAVAPALGRRGVGSALVAFAQGQAAGDLALSVNTFNRGAARLYERAGFRRTGETVDADSGLPVWTYAWRPVTAEHNS